MAHILIFIHWFVLVFTFGNVELVTIDNSKSNDFPIEELNDYTLREVFEDGNYITNGSYPFNDVTNWSPTSSATITIENDYIKVNSNFDGLVGALNRSQGIIGNQVYAYFEFIPSAKYSNQINLINFDITFNFDINQLNTFSRITMLTQIDSNRAYVSVGNGNYFYIKKLISIDMTALDISSLSVEQMDYWFNVYQENEQREVSETYDYIENELTTNDLIYIVLFALLWGLAIKIVKGVM